MFFKLYCIIIHIDNSSIIRFVQDIYINMSSAEDYKTIHVRIPKMVWKRIQEKAKKNCQSASSEIRSILIEHTSEDRQ